MQRSSCWTLALLVVLTTGSFAVAASAEEQAQATAAEEAIKEAGKLIAAKEYDKALPLLVTAQNTVAGLAAGTAEGKKLAKTLEPRVASARRILERAGIKVPAAEAPMTGTPSAGGISFTKQVAPILVARCNNCHITNMRGGFSMANFAALMKGSTAGAVVFPGKSDGSRMIEVLASGDMPRGGGRLSEDQINTIAKWIDAGAKFDGADQNAPISTGLPAQPQQPRLEVAKATGKESILFSRDIAPVLASQCTECHGGREPAARLALDSFRGLLAGNREGLIVTPGKSAESKLIARIKGMDVERMPLRKPPLSAEVIAKFEKWVAEGLKFDGSDANQSTEMVANVYKATQMSHKELAAERIQLANRNWTLSNPDDKPQLLETENFALVGNVGQSRLAEVGELAEAQQSKVAKIFKVSGSGPLVKGRVTIFAFNRRFDYSEYGTMVEKREIPSNWQGHWRYNVLDAYACIVLPTSGDSSLAGLVSEQLAGAYLDTLGSMPAWFTQGSAWAAGAAIDPKDPRSKQWDAELNSIVAKMSKPDDFLTGALPPADTAVANYSFCKFLMADAKGYTALLNAVKGGKPFDQAFQQAFQADPKAKSAQWVTKLAAAKKK